MCFLFIQNEVGAEKTEIEKSHQSAEDKINQLQAHKMVRSSQGSSQYSFMAFAYIHNVHYEIVRKR